MKMSSFGIKVWDGPITTVRKYIIFAKLGFSKRRATSMQFLIVKLLYKSKYCEFLSRYLRKRAEILGKDSLYQ